MSQVMSPFEGLDPEFEYAQECYKYLVEREKDRLFFHQRSPELKYRATLIKRIKVLCYCHKLSLRVKYLSIYIMDFFMDNHHIIEDKLELTLVCSLSIAAKVEEKDNNIPKYKELFSSQNQYSIAEILDMELRILQFFKWVFLIPTAATYVDYFGVQCLKQIENKSFANIRFECQTYLSKTIETKFYRFYPSVVAASCIYCIREKFQLKPIWPQFVQNITKYSYNQIKECVYELKSHDYMMPVMAPVIKRVKHGLNDSGFVDSADVND